LLQRGEQLVKRFGFVAEIGGLFEHGRCSGGGLTQMRQRTSGAAAMGWPAALRGTRAPGLH
ncbi:MAG: hypothetical protein KA911_12295, partial [Xanthomonadales bacterium]|nr:hypothetical protein [Xanthomonadales bacterium]